MGEGPRGKEGKGEEERLCPLLPLQSFFPLPLAEAEISCAVAVNAQLTPSYSPNILQNGAGGGRCSSKRAPEANGPLHTRIRMGWGVGVARREELHS